MLSSPELDLRIARCLPELMDGWAEVRCFTGADDLWTVIGAMERRGYQWTIQSNEHSPGYKATFYGRFRSAQAIDRESPGRAVVLAALTALGDIKAGGDHTDAQINV